MGTTNSLVASVRSGQSMILNDEQERSLVPSVVHYGVEEKKVGLEAFEQASLDPKKYGDFSKTLNWSQPF
ncbi:DnaK-like molecular chaperone [Haemophilus influenzae]|uniref:DnaK-like molecular chaperone n=1 Tax=Haemophilus influenzae TaxID=727 RepID=A0A2X1PJK6_HAEIF|nr:DnaK-like molecular chaperone [Haemophilus influenzae]